MNTYLDYRRSQKLNLLDNVGVLLPISFSFSVSSAFITSSRSFKAESSRITYFDITLGAKIFRIFGGLLTSS